MTFRTFAPVQAARALSVGEGAPARNQIAMNRDLPLPVIARHAAMSSRTLSRRFREQVGTTPAHWLTRARVRRAQRLLETSELSVEMVATEAGFGSATVLRQHFGQIVGTSPLAYRRSFKVI